MTDHYVDADGNYIGGYGDGAVPELEGLINLGDNPPASATYIWDFDLQIWNPDPTVEGLRIEPEWRAQELEKIDSQLDALEEAEAGEPPVDLKAGTKAQWLEYRGLVRNWKEGALHYPDSHYRPARP